MRWLSSTRNHVTQYYAGFQTQKVFFQYKISVQKFTTGKKINQITSLIIDWTLIIRKSQCLNGYKSERKHKEIYHWIDLIKGNNFRTGHNVVTGQHHEIPEVEILS